MRAGKRDEVLPIPGGGGDKPRDHECSSITEIVPDDNFVLKIRCIKLQ